MKVTRKKPRGKTAYRPARRYVDQSKQITYAEEWDKTVNNPQVFTYMDINRNQNMIGVMRKHYEDIIRMYGIDLQYFRKFNTFFLDENESTANLIYGEDTTAEYYISGLVRGFLNIENYNFQYNMMGFELDEQITISIGIEDFRSRFATLVGKPKTEIFEVPVFGNMVTNDYSGIIDIPEFCAKIEGKIPSNLILEDVVPEMCERPLNSKFFKTINHITNIAPISGSLAGVLEEDYYIPFKVSGTVSGKLTYHSLENQENSPYWQIAPQVGDYFKLKYGEIEEDYEITQIIDRNLTNNSGINPLLGKYIFQCQAIRRASSHEEFSNINNSLIDELESTVKFKDAEESKTPDYTAESKECDNSVHNSKMNAIANKIYNYSDNDCIDYTYGGYSDYPN